MVADVRLEGIGCDAWHRFNEGDMAKQLSICPLAGTDMFQLQAPIPLEGELALDAAALSDFASSRVGRPIRVLEVSWASAFQMNARLAAKYRIGRVFLAGDAAHIHPPTGGQGLNTSVQDAYNLGWKLAAALRGADLLDSYEKSAARSRWRCSASRRSSSKPRNAATCAEAVKRSSSTLAIPNPH